jgi:uncharacterized protein with HEPN domain
MRGDDARLLDMLLAARKIVRFMQGVSFKAFEVNELLQSGVMREFTVLGEAARTIDPETKVRLSTIPWASIQGMRHRLVHEYFDVRLNVVWDTSQNDIPALIPLLEAAVPPDEED